MQRLSTPLLDRIREALAAEIDRTSLRATAREVGMSPSGPQKFVAGTDPYPLTRQRAHAWYVRTRAPHAHVDEAAAEAALLLLLGPPARRVPGLLERARDLIAEGYRSAGLEVPGWAVVSSC